MKSRIAAELARLRHERLAAMTPADRVALALRLSDEGLCSYMATHGVDRRTAIAQIEATRRAGRRHSACAIGDEH